jgi:hypothetical protein
VPVHVQVVESDTTDGSPAAMQRALRTVAKLMIRSYQITGDCVANPLDSRSSSALTVVPKGHPHDVDDAA